MKYLILVMLLLVCNKTNAKEENKTLLDPELIKYVFDKDDIDKRIQMAKKTNKMIAFDGDKGFETNGNDKDMPAEYLKLLLQETIITARYNNYVKLYPDKVCNSKSFVVCTQSVVLETRSKFGLSATGIILFMSIVVQEISKQKKSEKINPNEASHELFNFNVFILKIVKNEPSTLGVHFSSSPGAKEETEKMNKMLIKKTNDMIIKTLKKSPKLKETKMYEEYKALSL